MNKLVLAIAIAADIGMNKTFAYRALIAIEQPLDAEGFAVRLKRFGVAIYSGSSYRV